MKKIDIKYKKQSNIEKTIKEKNRNNDKKANLDKYTIILLLIIIMLNRHFI